MSETVALIVAAGSGERARLTPVPKQFVPLGGKPMLRRAVEAFAGHPDISFVQLVTRPEDRELCEAALSGLTLPEPIAGGATRQDSVRLGLEALAVTNPKRVLIHDAARPFVSATLISRVARALDDADAAVPLIPINDTLRKGPEQLLETVSREGLYRAQTPQGFRFQSILGAHRRFAAERVTDDIALAERAGSRIAAVPGEEENIKITTAEDFALAEKLAGGAAADIRTGTGFDAHRFCPGDHVWLCGVKIPHVTGLEGHSDADCGLHALTDAILGAIGAADIGAHFPPSDEQWKGAPSHLFLGYAATLVEQKGGAISHVDVTIICEQPKIGPHRDEMRSCIAEILGIDISRVSVKATTSDGLGFTGRREGIAAQAAATIRLPAR